MTSTPPPPRPFDPRPLTAPLDRAVVQQWARGFRAARGLPTGLPAGMVVAIVLFSTLFGALAVLGIVVTPFAPPVGIVMVVVAVVSTGAALGIAIPTGFAARRRQDAHYYRMSGFAEANGVEYIPVVPRPELPGMVFGLGDNRQTLDALRGTVPRFVEFGDYSYTTTQSNGKTTYTVTHRWGYVAIRLDVPLPNIVLDAVGNNGLFGSNLPRRPSKDQRLSLEGDFDRYFELYCPREYETDALYLFTPDVMARFIDNAALLDVEIVDDWLILYRQGGLPTESPETWAWLFGVVGSLLDKLSRWGRWRDERLVAAAPSAAPAPAPVHPAALLPFAAPAPTAAPAIPAPAPLPPLRRRPIGVAPEGRRLRPHFPIGAIVALGVVLLAPALLGLLVVAVSAAVSR
jgi:hypothetical protein